MFFPSKKGLCMTIICSAFILVFISPLILSMEPIGVITFNPTLTETILIIATAICLAWIWFGTGYKLEHSQLKMQYGPIFQTINVSEISKIRSTKYPFISPALSVDRLHIYYKKDDLTTISPKNKIEFIRQLLKENPQIQLDNKN
ncbi:PH domain-containing protein [Jeotgalibacillus marinus]|uniref:PH domain-containing protein n=1 Tax=Jeotgalibacillus marinus TaxID=86667 RepID=A0ABV3Q4Y1_9BACL